MNQEASRLKGIWETMAKKHAEMSVHSGGTGWWGKNYLARGQIRMSQRGMKWHLSYTKAETKGPNFERVVEMGRKEVDIPKMLLSVSKKVRISPIIRTKTGKYKSGGKKILVVPLPAGKEEPVNFYMSIKGTYRDDQGVKRNKYDYDRQSKGNTAGFYQEHEKGGGSLQKRNLVTISEKSRWKPYPKIKAQHYKRKMREEAQQLVQSQQFNKDLAQACITDISLYVRAKNPTLYRILKQKGILK